MMKRRLMTGLVLALCMLMVPGCARDSPPPTAEQPGPDLGAAVVTVTADEYGITAYNYPRIDGSTSTLSIALAVNKAMFESSDNPYYPEQASKTVPSYKLLIDGQVDLILVPSASADVLALAESKEVELELHPIAAEALVFITPADNPAQNISREQVRRIYLQNSIGNWSELGGPDRLLVPICRNADSGSQSQLDNLVLDNEKMHPAIKKNHVELTMEGMLEQVAFYHSGGISGKPTDSYALGYTLYTYLKGMGEITGIDEQLKRLAFDGVTPSDENIADGSYPLADFYYAAVRADLPLDHSGRRIIDWLQSPAGQQAVRDLRLIPIGEAGD